MESYRTLDAAQLQQALLRERERHDSFCAQGLALNMARGKPSDEQLDLSSPLLSILAAPADCQAADGTDCRNYGILAGIPEARELMASVLDDDPATTIVFGSSSLTAMYDALARLMAFGTEGHEPWGRQGPLRWLCPVPGYDRHFSITEAFGIEMLPVPLVTEGPSLGPAMDEVERLVAEDPSIKGIWCVPKYANPSGITYADDVVRRLAAMECAAPDFRIFWDNAYSVHHLSDDATRQDALHRPRLPRGGPSEPLPQVRVHLQGHLPRRRHSGPCRQPRQRRRGPRAPKGPDDRRRQTRPAAP